MATWPTLLNQNSKNQKGAITFEAHRHNVNVLLSDSTFLIFAPLKLRPYGAIQICLLLLLLL